MLIVVVSTRGEINDLHFNQILNKQTTTKTRTARLHLDSDP
jgi:hypothetical protein